MIVRAAIRTPDGVVHSLPQPARHGDVILAINGHALTPEGGVDRKLLTPVHDQGFLTDAGEYVDRIEGARHAIACGQIAALRWPPYLYSEDLW